MCALFVHIVGKTIHSFIHSFIQSSYEEYEHINNLISIYLQVTVDKEEVKKGKERKKGKVKKVKKVIHTYIYTCSKRWSYGPFVCVWMYK